MPNEPRKETTINEDAGLPDNWVPIDVPPIIPGAPLSPTPNSSGQGPSAYYVGSLSPSLQHDANFIKTGYQTSPVAVSPLMPLSLGGSAFNNAAIFSAQTLAPVTPVTPVIPPVPGIQLFEINGQDLGTINYINGFAV